MSIEDAIFCLRIFDVVILWIDGIQYSNRVWITATLASTTQNSGCPSIIHYGSIRAGDAEDKKSHLLYIL